jgi:thymidylate kinase
MYICLEGLKGSGKSTLLTAAQQLLTAQRVAYGLVALTRAVPEAQSWPERLSARLPCLRRLDAWNDYLYTCRANHAAAQAEWDQPLVLGDRSIVTSYATRWRKWGSPQRCIARVDSLETQVPAPDHVILLEVEPVVAWQRARERARIYGQQDETLQRLTEAREAYEQIPTFGIARLAATHWHRLDANQTPALVFRDWVRLMRELTPPTISTPAFPLIS